MFKGRDSFIHLCFWSCERVKVRYHVTVWMQCREHGMTPWTEKMYSTKYMCSIKITRRIDDNPVLFPQGKIPSSPKAQNSVYKPGSKQITTHRGHTPTRTVNSTRRMEATVKGWIGIKSLYCTRTENVSMFHVVQTGGHFISDGFTEVSCRLQGETEEWWCFSGSAWYSLVTRGPGAFLQITTERQGDQ